MRQQQEAQRQQQQRQQAERQQQAFRQQVERANQAQRDQNQRQARALEERGRELAAARAATTAAPAGWRAPDDTEVHPSGGTVPRGLERRWRRSALGQARGIQQHSPRWNTSLITAFRLERFAPDRGRLPAGAVRLRGQAAVGFANDGDWVEALGWQRGGVVRARRAFNHSTGAAYRRPLTALLLPAAAIVALVGLVSLVAFGAGLIDRPGRSVTVDTTGDENGSENSESTLAVGTGETTETTAGDQSSSSVAARSIGDPDDPGLPPEHRASVIGPDRAELIEQKAEDEGTTWARAVAASIGDVESLEPEFRHEFIGQNEVLGGRMKDCLAEDEGALWFDCAEKAVSPEKHLVTVESTFRLDAWPDDAEFVAADTLECLAESGSATRWLDCSAKALAGYWRVELSESERDRCEEESNGDDIEFVRCAVKSVDANTDEEGLGE